MKEIENDFNFFVKDERLSICNGFNEDRFLHKHFSEIIMNIIENQVPPYNISLIGRWGIGKSSIISMFENIMKDKYKERKQFDILEINAWKYEKESIRKVLITKLYEKIGGNVIDERSEIIKTLYNTSIDIKDDKIKFCYRLLASLANIMIFVIPTYISYIMFNKMLKSLSEGDSKNDLIITIISTVFTICIDFFAYLKKNKVNLKSSIQLPPRGTEEFERLLIKELNSKSKDYKLICVIDDLDRLPPNKIVEALDAIKSFVGIDNCIFIVPYDEQLVKNAIKKYKEDIEKDSYDIIKSELLLNKLFQFRIEIPEIIEEDMFNYAKELSNNKLVELIEYCDLKASDSDYFNVELLSILIHPSVQTPRQVIKILNTFSSNLLLFMKRSLGKISTDVDKKSLQIIAKLSVLQSDFNYFYNDLKNNPKLINEILNNDSKVSGEQSKNDDMLESYKNEKNIKDLINFLQFRPDIVIDDIYKYIYFSENEGAINLGKDLYNSILADIKSCNIDFCNNICEEDIENVIELIKIKINDERSIVYIVNMLFAYLKFLDGIYTKIKDEDRLISYFEFFSKTFSRQFDSIYNCYNNLLNQRAQEVDILLLLRKYKDCDNRKGLNLLIEYKMDNIDFYNINISDDYYNIESFITNLLEYSSVLEENTRVRLIQFLEKIINVSLEMLTNNELSLIYDIDDLDDFDGVAFPLLYLEYSFLNIKYFEVMTFDSIEKQTILLNKIYICTHDEDESVCIFQIISQFYKKLFEYQTENFDNNIKIRLVVELFEYKVISISIIPSILKIINTVNTETKNLLMNKIIINDIIDDKISCELEELFVKNRYDGDIELFDKFFIDNFSKFNSIIEIVIKNITYINGMDDLIYKINSSICEFKLDNYSLIKELIANYSDNQLIDLIEKVISATFNFEDDTPNIKGIINIISSLDFNIIITKETYIEKLLVDFINSIDEETDPIIYDVLKVLLNNINSNLLSNENQNYLLEKINLLSEHEEYELYISLIELIYDPNNDTKSNILSNIVQIIDTIGCNDSIITKIQNFIFNDKYYFDGVSKESKTVKIYSLFVNKINPEKNSIELMINSINNSNDKINDFKEILSISTKIDINLITKLIMSIYLTDNSILDDCLSCLVEISDNSDIIINLLFVLYNFIELQKVKGYVISLLGKINAIDEEFDFTKFMEVMNMYVAKYKSTPQISKIKGELDRIEHIAPDKYKRSLYELNSTFRYSKSKKIL